MDINSSTTPFWLGSSLVERNTFNIVKRFKSVPSHFLSSIYVRRLLYAASSITGNILRMEGSSIIKITKNEAFYLRSKGFKDKSDIHQTYSGHPTYYASEKRSVMKALEKYRER